MGRRGREKGGPVGRRKVLQIGNLSRPQPTGMLGSQASSLCGNILWSDEPVVLSTENNPRAYEATSSTVSTSKNATTQHTAHSRRFGVVSRQSAKLIFEETFFVVLLLVFRLASLIFEYDLRKDCSVVLQVRQVESTCLGHIKPATKKVCVGEKLSLLVRR